MKRVPQIIIKVLILLMMLQPVFITSCQAGFWGDVLSTGNNFIQEGQSQDSPIDQDDLKTEIGKLYNMLFIIGVIMAVLIGAILGIKFMLGSVDEQAKIKEMLIPYIAGCIVIFGAFGIWKLIVTILNGVTT